ncbi:MAG: hypothetical protein ACTSRW_09540 [Candidatus Helarchaeota archaeon]
MSFINLDAIKNWKFFNREALKTWKHVALLISFLGGVQFFVLITLSMLFYPGGYPFLSEFFSSLGDIRTKPWTILPNYPNYVSFTLFVIAVIASAVTMIPFWLVMRTVFTGRRITSLLSLSGTILGIMSAVSFILMALLPTDFYKLPHIIAGYCFLLFFTLAIAVYSIGILLNRNFPNKFAYGGIVLAFLSLLDGIGGGLKEMGIVLLPINPHIFVQKIIIFCLILWVVIQIFPTWDEILRVEDNNLVFQGSAALKETK